MILGKIYLPSGSGTPVGSFEFITDPVEGKNVEIGTPIAADTDEGVVVGVVVDMRTVGTSHDPVLADLTSTSAIAKIKEVVLATVQVFFSDSLRPVTSGIVRDASAEEVLKATGYQKLQWPIPAGVIKLADGTYTKICFDGTSLLGPESAHLNVGGLSGQAAKTSYMGTLLASCIQAGTSEHKVGALVFNVKGDDLVYLDQPVTNGYELSEVDLAIYSALGLTPKPFENVTVYAPSLPAGQPGTRSNREDSLNISWDLNLIWPYLRHFLGNIIYEDEKLSSFLAEFRSIMLNHDNLVNRIDSFDKLDAWFSAILAQAEENESLYAWRSHHKATVWRVRRMLMGIVSRCGGLVINGQAKSQHDIPASNWVHGQIIVVDIAGLTADIQSVIIARTLERVLKSAENGELGVEHLVVIADELNTFAPSIGSEMQGVKKVLQKISTQGRYAGISLWGAGQKLSKVDELVRDNAATRALGITSDGELSSGVYGRMPAGMSERIATLEKGTMALTHYSFRAIMLAKFPRPAWRTGKARTSGSNKSSNSNILNLSPKSYDRLVEGVNPDLVNEIIASSDSSQEASDRIIKTRVPDMSKVAVHEPSTFDEVNPFDIS
jgi:hypothetical protein